MSEPKQSPKWFEVICNKCEKQFSGEYKEGTSVFCNKCARWIEVGEDDDTKGRS